VKLDKNIVIAAVAAFALAWFMCHSDGYIPNPFVPQRPDRPVLKFIAKVAKTFLWIAVFAEPKPQQPPHHIVQASVGPDGTELLHHGDL